MSDDTAPKLNGPDLRSGVALESLAENSPLLGHVDGEAIILVRQGENIFATGAARRRCARTERKKNRFASLAAMGTEENSLAGSRNIPGRPTISLEVPAPSLAMPRREVRQWLLPGGG